MVDVIYDLKNQLLEQMEQEIGERGIDRLDKEKVDMVKDLAAAEKYCWEAEYYRGVAEAMEGSGYPQGGSGYPQGSRGGQGGSQGGQGGSGYPQGGSGYAMGYPRSGYPSRDSRGRYSRRGYPMENLRTELQNADPQERERMKQELRQMMEQM